MAARRLHEVMGRPDHLASGQCRDAHGHAARRLARVGRGPVGTGSRRDRAEPWRATGGAVRWRLGGPAAAPARAHRGGRPQGGAALVDSTGLPGRSAAYRADLRRGLLRELPRLVLQCRLSGLRAYAHRRRSRSRGQQQAGGEYVTGRDRRTGPCRCPRAGHRRSVRDLRRRHLICRIGGVARSHPPP